MLAALAVAAAIVAGPTPGPGPGLTDAVRMASAVQWNAAVTWNAAVAYNEAVEAQRRQHSQMTAAMTGDKSTKTSATKPRSDTRSSWAGTAECESGGNWSTNTGNGYFGGLQMDMAFWRAHGGLAYAPRPDLASADEQVTVAERAGSRDPWPVCGSR